MADDLTNKGPNDRNRINMHEDYEVKYWSHHLGVSREELKRASTKSVIQLLRSRRNLEHITIDRISG